MSGRAEEGGRRRRLGRWGCVLYVANLFFCARASFSRGNGLLLIPPAAKSKKQRRIAAKRQRTIEAKLIASGDLEALAPKIPLQHQSINLPGSPDGTLEENVEAIKKREELRKAMRKERKAKIKETNYLKSM